MHGFWSFVQAYLSNGAFPLLHLLIAAAAGYLIVAWRKTAFARIPMAASISPEQYQNAVESLAPFDVYFDFCSSAFIFIGLLGTIGGFFGAVPQLKNENYDFHDVERALATSGIGIVLAILLNAYTSWFYRFGISPRLESARGRIGTSSLQSVISQNLIEQASLLRVALAQFDRGVQDLTLSMRRIDASISDSTNAVAALSNTTTENAVRLEGTIARLDALPNTLGDGIQTVFDQAVASFRSIATDFEGVVNSVGGIPVQVHRKMTEALDPQVQTLEALRTEVTGLFDRSKNLPAEMHEAIQAITLQCQRMLQSQNEAFNAELAKKAQQLIESQISLLMKAQHELTQRSDVLKDSFGKVFNEEKTLIHDAIMASMGEMHRLVIAQRDQLREVGASLPDEVLAAHRDLLLKTSKLSGDLVASSDRLAGTLAELPAAFAAAEPLSANLNEAGKALLSMAQTARDLTAQQARDSQQIFRTPKTSLLLPLPPKPGFLDRARNLLRFRA